MYLRSGEKEQCFGCEACVQICSRKALTMQEDEEGFRYPSLDHALCVNCGLCQKVCPYEYVPQKHHNNKYVFGGYSIDPYIRAESTSGGAFSVIVDAFCVENYVIFGAESKGLIVFHSYITDKKDLGKFRKSKYSQSIIGGSYKKVNKFLAEGKKVLFSGTPCQIAGLYAYLKAVNFHNIENLLTVEVVCEGVPSPLYVRKMDKAMETKYGSRIESLDYRYKGRSLFGHCKLEFQVMKSDISRGGDSGKWDFEIMRIQLMNKRVLTKDRWFNPFWSVWLQHLMSRPSCYECPFTCSARVADITLGDLWGVHFYCPELYGNNGGASLVVCNTEKGKKVFRTAQSKMYGHELVFEDAVKYQGPMRRPIAENPERDRFMSDLSSEMDYHSINRKWAKPPTMKLLFKKYIWGNRQKVFVWNIKQRMKQH
ncbi:MAG: Coenzyme F420 hydrogenase/dehydrogenase, beta subunit C-terminal domain [Clostridia bacterium]|nr:Coenzyme F420 hydrogenase/dehydrogenase, beta subunit C-terminal domain [Clostridia bacterium]